MGKRLALVQKVTTTRSAHFKERDDPEHNLSLQGATNGSDAAIHHVSKYAFGQCGSLAGSQWIATPFRLAMTGGRKKARAMTRWGFCQYGEKAPRKNRLRDGWSFRS